MNPLAFFKRTSRALSCLVLLAFAALNTACATPPSGNLVVIHVDDLGWRDLGYMGSPVYETPHIDALAESGTFFTDAYAAAPICTPARVAMLTGSQPSRHGVYTVVKNRGGEGAMESDSGKERTLFGQGLPHDRDGSLRGGHCQWCHRQMAYR